MRKFAVAALTIWCFTGLTSDAVAESVKTTDAGAKCITISGEIELDFVSKSAFFGDLNRYRGVPMLAVPGSGSLTDLGFSSLAANEMRAFDIFDGRNSNSESFVDPEITLNFDIEMIDNVRGFIQLENQQRSRAPLHAFIGHDTDGGLNQGYPYLGGGLVTQRSGDNNLQFHIEQAFIEYDGLIENLRVRAGISDLMYDIRGDGNAFFMDIAESEGVGPEIIIPGMVGNFQPVQSLEFGGLIATHTAPDLYGGALYTDAFLGVLVETGTWQQDQALWGFMSQWKQETEDPDINNTLEFGSYVINVNSKAQIWNIVTGWDWNFINIGDTGGNLEFFAEWLVQSGEFATSDTLEMLYPQRFFEEHSDGSAPEFRGTSHVGSDILTQPAGAARSNDFLPPYDNDMEQKSWGYYFGAKYVQANNDWRPWVEFMYMYLSGDDGGFGGDPGKIFHANEDFVSFEDNDATIIVEENDYGLDLDNNYWKIQVSAGAKLNPLFNNAWDVDMKVLYAFFEAIDTPWAVRDDIGSEIDAVFTWNYTKDLSFTLGMGFLMGSQYFDDLDDRAYLIQDGPIVDLKDHAGIFFIDTILRF